jgi:microfibrillar-associated protein 1
MLEIDEEATTGPPDVDDTDGLDEEAEFEAWKIRELLRIKRDKEERIA